MKKFELIDEYGGSEVIRNTRDNLNVFFLATTGFGTTSKMTRLAERVVEFLNSLPDEETQTR